MLKNMSAIIDIYIYVNYFRHMDIQKALIVFDALSQETRLGAFRLLVKAGKDGMPAGKLGEALGTAHNTLSFHLSHLTNAGVVTSHKSGRSVIYIANFEAIQGLIGFIAEDCCRDEYISMTRDKKSGSATVRMWQCC